MSNGPEPDTPDEDGDAGLSDPFGDLRGPDAREILSDGSGGTLVETTGEGDDAGRGGPQEVVAEKSVDEVFERFDENSPEEIMAADDRPDPEPDRAIVEGDVDGLFGDLDDVDPEETADDDAVTAAVESVEAGGSEELSGRDPERVVSDRNVDDLLGTVRDASEDGLFEDHGGHKRVVADSSVDEVFQRYVEDDPEDVMDADDPALESPTEAELRSLGQRDGILGELPDPPEDARDPDGFGAFVEETDGMLEKTGKDTHRSVGDTDVDAVFERYEEDTVEEVIEADDLDPEDDEMVETEVDESVEALFGDLDDVSLETSPVPAVEDDGPTPAPSPTETADAIEGLLTDLSDVDIDEDAGPAPEETAKEIEGLLDDLSTVQVEASSPMTDASATPAEAAVDASDAPAELERTGADTHRTVGESAVDDVVGVEANRTPADGVADVSATDLFCAFNGEGPVDLPEDLAMADGWGPTAVEAGDRTATAVFDDLGGRVADVPAVTTPEPEPDAPSIDLEAPDDAATADADAELAATPGAPGAGTPGANDTGAADGEMDVPEIDLGDPEPATAGDQGEADDADPGEVEIPEIDLGDAEPATAGGEKDGESDAGPTDPDPDEEMDVPEIDLGAPGDEGDDADAASETETEQVTATERGQATERTADTERTMAKTANTDTDSDDVDDLFDGYEEDTPEEIIASAGDPGQADEPADELVGDVEGLFGDLSEVDLEPEAAETDDRPTTDRAPDSEEAVEEVETMFSDLSSVDVEPEPASEPEPAETGPASTDLEPAHERGDESTVVGRRDVDAVFEDFAEETVEEVIETDDEPITLDQQEDEDEDDEPAEVETGDFMKELAAGKDPEEIGITVYDGSQTDSGGDAIAESEEEDDDEPSIELSAPETGSDDAPSIETPSPSSGDDAPSIEDPTGAASADPSTGATDADAGVEATGDADADEDPSPRVSTDDLFEEMNADGGATGESAAFESEASGEETTEESSISTDDLFEEMSTGDSDDDAWATVTDTEPVDDPSGPSKTPPTGDDDRTESAPEPSQPAREPTPPTESGSGQSSDRQSEDRRSSRQQSGGSPGRTQEPSPPGGSGAKGPSQPATPGDAPAKGGSAGGDEGRYTAGGGGPGSETLFPDAAEESDDASTIEGSSLDDDDESVVGALKLLVDRVKRRVQSLF